MTKRNLGEESISTSQLTVHHKGKSGQEVKAGTWRWALKQKPWKNAVYCVAFQLLALIAFLHNSGPLPGDGTAHDGLSSSISINN